MAAGRRTNLGRSTPVISRLHIVTDDRVLAAPGFRRKAEAALASGGGRVTLHLRGPRTSARRLWELGAAVRITARAHDIPLLVNDRVDLALALGASGVHLGVRSLPAPNARAILGSEALLGCSVHSGEEARSLAHRSGQAFGSPDFVMVGTLFRTPSHPHRLAAGTNVIPAVADVIPTLPLVGIGGVTVDRLQEVIDAGAYGVAVIRAVWEAPDPAEAVRALLECMDTCRSPQQVGMGSSTGD